MRIGFIGLGVMGRPMAKNLLKAGYKLWVNDHNEDKVEDVVRAGAVAACCQKIGETCELVFTMLPNGPHVTEALFGENGVAAYMRPGTAVIDMSSVNPDVSRKLAERLEQRNIEMLDAPVSGGEPKAVDGTLSFMVGGKKEVFDRYKQVLSCMGSSVVYCGGIGAGNTVKLANQIIVALNIAACSEAFTFAKIAGVEPETVFAAIRGGLAGSTVMDAKVPMMIAGDFTPGFRIDLHRKDLDNVLECAHSAGAPVPLTAQIQEILINLHARGHGKDDHSGIANYYAALSGIAIGEQTCIEEENKEW